MAFTPTGTRCTAETVTDDDIRHIVFDSGPRDAAIKEIALYALHGTQTHVRMLCRERMARIVNISNGIFDN